jgi:hypothetical protein
LLQIHQTVWQRNFRTLNRWHGSAAKIASHCVV